MASTPPSVSSSSIYQLDSTSSDGTVSKAAEKFISDATHFGYVNTSELAAAVASHAHSESQPPIDELFNSIETHLGQNLGEEFGRKYADITEKEKPDSTAVAPRADGNGPFSQKSLQEGATALVEGFLKPLTEDRPEVSNADIVVGIPDTLKVLAAHTATGVVQGVGHLLGYCGSPLAAYGASDVTEAQERADAAESRWDQGVDSVTDAVNNSWLARPLTETSKANLQALGALASPFVGAAQKIGDATVGKKATELAGDVLKALPGFGAPALARSAVAAARAAPGVVVAIPEAAVNLGRGAAEVARQSGATIARTPRVAGGPVEPEASSAGNAAWVSAGKVASDMAGGQRISARGEVGASGAATSRVTPHLTEKLWVKNADGARSLEDAINFADAQGAFGSSLVDYRVIAPDNISVEFAGFKIRFKVVDDATFDKYNGIEPFAKYRTTDYPNLTDPKKPMTFKDLFEDEALVTVRQSVLESDRGLTAVLGHEYYEIGGLSGRAIPYGDVQGEIDTLHNGAVNHADKLVWDMIGEGL